MRELSGLHAQVNDRGSGNEWGGREHSGLHAQVNDRGSGEGETGGPLKPAPPPGRNRQVAPCPHTRYPLPGTRYPHTQHTHI